jgi:hypothetical protein
MVILRDRFVPELNKAHTATARRIAARYGTVYNDGEGVDIESDGMAIEVETTATIEEGVQRLRNHVGRAFVAVTNKEGLAEALRLTQGTNIGVMDPRGNIIKESEKS